LEFDRAHSKVYITSTGDISGVAAPNPEFSALRRYLSQLEDVAIMPHPGAPDPNFE